jgi:hypothetical protein
MASYFALDTDTSDDRWRYEPSAAVSASWQCVMEEQSNGDEPEAVLGGRVARRGAG